MMQYDDADASHAGRRRRGSPADALNIEHATNAIALLAVAMIYDTVYNGYNFSTPSRIAG